MMMIRALNVIGLVLAMALAVGLYRAKTEAHAAREHLDRLAAMVETERRASATLRAEIAFLERPERLRALAARHLGLEPADSSREMPLEQVLLALGGDSFAPPAPSGPSARVAAASPPPVSNAVAPAPAPPSRAVAMAQAEPAPESPENTLRTLDDPIAALILAGGVR